MVSPTSPDGIPRPVGGDGFKLLAFMSSLGDAIQSALDRRGPVMVANEAGRDAFFPNPVQGQLCNRTDTNWSERYYGVFNSTTNPGGAGVAGWYPESGKMPKIRLHKTDTQTLPTNAFTDIVWNQETYKNAITHSNAGGAPITIQVSGRYSFNVRVALNGEQVLTLQIQRNGVDLPRFATDANGTTANFTKAQMTGTETFMAGDVIRIRARAATSVTLESSQCYMDLAYDAAPV